MNRLFLALFCLTLQGIVFGQTEQEVVFDKGVGLLKKGSYKEAVKIFSEVIPTATDKKLKKFCYIYRALSYNGLYDRYILLATDDAQVYFNRGALKGMLVPADLESSISDYDKAIQLKPDYAEAFANRGVAKINLLTTRGTTQPSKDQTTDACMDLKKARSLGDKTVEDMIFVYCDKK